MKQHRLILTVAMTFFALCMVAFTAKTIAQAPGTEDNPFLVATVADLQKVGSDTDGWTLSAHYRQTADIDLTSVSNWTPIGDRDNRFTGTYDGYGYSISNLTLNNSVSDYQGLFGYTSAGSVIRNVALQNASVKGKNYVGGIIGFNSNSTIENCYVTGSIEGEQTAGGIAGANTYSNGIIQNCYTTCSVTSNGIRAGGIVGNNYLSGKVQYCYATGAISSATGQAGGIVGIQGGDGDDGKTNNCVALNSEVSQTIASPSSESIDLGRIAGAVTIGTTPSDVFANNFGQDNMVLLDAGNPVTAVSDTSDIHGADIRADYYEGIYSSFWWNMYAGFSKDNWSFAGGRLPILKPRKTVSNISLTVTAPVNGATPVVTGTVAVGDTAKYRIYNNSVTWLKGGTVENPELGEDFETFVAGETYIAMINIETVNGHIFVAPLTCTVNGVEAYPYIVMLDAMNHLVLYTIAFTAISENERIITATAGANGIISPSGAITVTEGEDQTFTFSANSGYEIYQVLIDGTNNPAAVTAGSYTFENITENHTIDVTFKATTTGISEVSANAIAVYPNPTDGKLFIESGDLHVEKVEVLDITGRTVLTSHETEISISHLSAGTYFVKLKTNKGRVVKKVVKE